MELGVPASFSKAENDCDQRFRLGKESRPMENPLGPAGRGNGTVARLFQDIEAGVFSGSHLPSYRVRPGWLDKISSLRKQPRGRNPRPKIPQAAVERGIFVTAVYWVKSTDNVGLKGEGMVGLEGVPDPRFRT